MKNNKMTLLNTWNMIAITFYVVAIPGYYFLDYRIMNGIFATCGIFVFLCLLQFVFYGRLRLLAIALSIFIVHVLCKT